MKLLSTRAAIMGSTAAAFVLLAVPFGLFFSIINPPFQGPDEPHHFYRAYQVSRGQVIPTRFPNGVGGLIPADIVETGKMLAEVAHEPREKVSSEEIAEGLTRRPPSDRLVETHFEGAALYSPVPYAPQAVVIGLGRSLDLPPLVLMYLGRVANLAVWIALVFAALRIAPLGQWAFLVLGLTPMSLFIAGTLSVDPVTNGLALVWTAVFLRMVVGDEPVSTRATYLAATLTVLLTLCKQPFFLMSALFMVVPASRFGDPARKKKTVALLMVANAVAATTWGWISVDLFEPLRTAVVVDPDAQISFMLQHPLSTARAIFSTYFSPQAVGEIVPGFIGIFGWLDTHLPSWVVGLHYGLIVFALAGVARPGMVVGKLRRYLVGGIAFVCFLAITLALYTTWNAVGSPVVVGIQARYFIPLSWLLVPLCADGFRMRVNMTDQSARFIVLGGLVITLGASLVTMYARYYVA